MLALTMVLVLALMLVLVLVLVLVLGRVDCLRPGVRVGNVSLLYNIAVCSRCWHGSVCSFLLCYFLTAVVGCARTALSILPSSHNYLE